MTISIFLLIIQSGETVTQGNQWELWPGRINSQVGSVIEFSEKNGEVVLPPINMKLELTVGFSHLESRSHYSYIKYLSFVYE